MAHLQHGTRSTLAAIDRYILPAWRSAANPPAAVAAVDRWDALTDIHLHRPCFAYYASTTNNHTHTHPFNGPLSRTTRVSRYQKGKFNLDFTEARDCEWQWHQLGHMQVCTSLQTDNHASTPPLSFFTDRMPSLPPNEQRQNTEGRALPTIALRTVTELETVRWR